MTNNVVQAAELELLVVVGDRDVRWVDVFEDEPVLPQLEHPLQQVLDDVAAVHLHE